MLFKPSTVLKFMSLWPPYLASGIRIKEVNNDFTQIKVEMNQYFFNTNYVGTHFGGSLYAMCDPFYMFILLQHLGSDHIVWDKAASIEFVKPGQKKVCAIFKIDPSEIENIRNDALNSYKVEPVFKTVILNQQNEIIAKVSKKLYVRRKDAKNLIT